MGVPESRSSDLASVPFHRAGTQADGGAMEAISGIAERSTTQGAMRSIILLLYPGVLGRKGLGKVGSIQLWRLASALNPVKSSSPKIGRASCRERVQISVV